MILIVGGGLCAGAYDMAMFIVGRVVAGIGAGMLAHVVPIYQSEISTPETRGAMVCVTGIMYAYGYSLAGWLGFACFFIPGKSRDKLRKLTANLDRRRLAPRASSLAFSTRISMRCTNDCPGWKQ